MEKSRRQNNSQTEQRIFRSRTDGNESVHYELNDKRKKQDTRWDCSRAVRQNNDNKQNTKGRCVFNDDRVLAHYPCMIRPDKKVCQHRLDPALRGEEMTIEALVYRVRGRHAW